MDKKKYEEIKNLAKEMEVKNLESLILFKSGKEWYKMGGNSLLIYYFKIAPQLKIKPNIQPDTDYTKKIFEDGVISFRGVANLKTKLERLKFLKSVKEKNGLVIFELTFRLEKTQIRDYKVELQEEREKIMKTIAPEVVVAPEIYEKIRFVQKRIFEIVRKLSVYERKYNGELMAEYSRKMAKYYLMINTGMIAEKEGWKKILEMTKLLMMEIVFAMDLKMINQDTGARVSEEIVKVKKMVEKQLKKER